MKDAEFTTKCTKVYKEYRAKIFSYNFKFFVPLVFFVVFSSCTSLGGS